MSSSSLCWLPGHTVHKCHCYFLTKTVVILHAQSQLAPVCCWSRQRQQFHQPNTCPDKLTPTIMQSIGPLSYLLDLGGTFDKSLSFGSHARQLTKSCFFHLQSIIVASSDPLFYWWIRDDTCLHLISHGLRLFLASHWHWSVDWKFLQFLVN